jgi:exopolysaccharide production protein ExoZ
MADALLERAAPHGHMAEIVSIQYLRAFAALTVVAFHALGAAPHFPVGAAGVDVFFVISGFIMWTLTAETETSPARFLWRRIVRVAPTYWVATFVVAGIWALRPHFLWMPPFTWGELLKSLLFAPHRDGWGRDYPVLTQGWTLNYEMFFYLVFTGVLLLPRRRQFTALTAVLLGLAAAGLLLRPTDPVGATYLNPLLLEFLAGAWLGRAWRAGWLRSRSLGSLLLGAGLAIFAIENGYGLVDPPWRALVWGAPAVLLVAGGLSLEGAGAMIRSRPLKALGDGSYSIYLFHPAIVALGERVLAPAPTLVRLTATVAACGLAGVILHRVLEQPVTAALRRLGRRTVIAAAPAAAPLASG